MSTSLAEHSANAVDQTIVKSAFVQCIIDYHKKNRVVSTSFDWLPGDANIKLEKEAHIML